MPKNLFSFLVTFLVILVVSYFVQIWLINFFSFHSNSNILHLSYIFNLMYTLCLVITIVILSKRLKDQIGFIFLAGSFMKIGVFLALIKLNNLEMDKKVFFDFFIPYVISLILEVYYISKILNNIK